MASTRRTPTAWPTRRRGLAAIPLAGCAAPIAALGSGRSRSPTRSITVTPRGSCCIPRPGRRTGRWPSARDRRRCHDGRARRSGHLAAGRHLHGHGGSDLGHYDLASYLASMASIPSQPSSSPETRLPRHERHRRCHGAGGGRAIEVHAADPDDALPIPSGSRGRRGTHRRAGFSADTPAAVVGARAAVRSLPWRSPEPDPQDVDTCEAAKKLSPQAVASYLAELQRQFTRWGPTADSVRVKAAFVMGAAGVVFDASGAEAINRPVHLCTPRRTTTAPSAVVKRAAHLGPLGVRQTIVRTNAVPKADHWVFLAPCSAALAKDMPRDLQGPARRGSRPRACAHSRGRSRRSSATRSISALTY